MTQDTDLRKRSQIVNIMRRSFVEHLSHLKDGGLLHEGREVVMHTSLPLSSVRLWELCETTATDMIKRQFCHAMRMVTMMYPYEGEEPSVHWEPFSPDEDVATQEWLRHLGMEDFEVTLRGEFWRMVKGQKIVYGTSRGLEVIEKPRPKVVSLIMGKRKRSIEL